ncbi:MAG: type I phosphomannose isomerase catalytic subunit [Bacteroidales bacterium]|nr:type I phosphomannose isomerase catalytic subunit [Bacteroidales bacterium]
MEKSLYPLKFTPIYKTPIWGGNGFKTKLHRTNAPEKCGESWEVSDVKDNVSVVCNGFLAGNDLSELLEVYMGDLVGDSVYEKFGNDFPLLIKFIDANDKLSVQVHPDDDLAAEKHNSYGKTEMWYVLEAEKDAELVCGFNREVSKEEYLAKTTAGSLTELLNYIKVKKDDVFFIPAGRVHAIGAGIMLAEIQQSSDITYRIYDYDRKGADGKPRELHLAQAAEAIDYEFYGDYKISCSPVMNKTVNAVDCQYFTTNVFRFNMPVEKDFPEIDSFIIYMCTEGGCRIEYEGGEDSVALKKGETVLVPAMIKNLCFYPEKETSLIEVYIKS